MTNLYEKPKLTYFLMLVCIAVFVLEIYYGLQYGSFGSENFGNGLAEFFSNYGFSFQNILGQKFWVFITSIFIHADPEHLVLNLIALFFFGRVIEMGLGRKKFLLIFFLSAIVGNLAFLVSSLFLTSYGTVVIGASAAIFGLMGAAMLVKPFEFVFYPYLIPVPVIIVATLYTLYSVTSFLLVATNIESSNIAYVSHIGGIVTGMFFGFREEKSKKGFLILLILLVLLIVTPLIWIFINYLEIFNYISVLSNFFK